MKTIILITLILGIAGLVANTIWAIVGAKKDKITGNKWATIDRNLKAAGINLGITVVIMVMIIVARVINAIST